ncbi:hypothetical protein EDD75_1846 [Thermodesulfitimonas autotrophica]|uniref:Glycosyltransferase RgtA/B/C/D-like domain-containing protein n=1 Tax=Thermodesulfitimonas autotrophica TaxID=1894989 RepID=A0A3N5ACX2_9THEO|nr:hypothetical protein EDD75_1846 [Thermodesulfitimonas autotrophica]
MFPSGGTVTPRRYPRFFWLLFFGVPVLTLLPYLMLYAAAPPGTTFTGFFFASDDLESYLTDMRMAEYGWKWNFMFTAEDTRGGYIFLYYIFWGKLALWLHLPLIVAFHLARITASLLLILAAWRYLNTFSLREAERRWGLVFFCLAIQFPRFYDREWGLLLIFHPEFYPAANMLLLPHVAFSQAMFLFAAYCLREWARTRKVKYILCGNAALLGLVLVHPYMLLPYALLALLTLYFHRGPRVASDLRALASFLLLATPYLVYLYFLMHQPDIRAWQAQSATLTPWREILTRDAALLLPALAGLLVLWRREGPRREAACFWAAPFLPVLFPLSFQERLLEAAGPGFCFAAGIAVAAVASWCRTRWGPVVLTLILLAPLSAVCLTPVNRPSAWCFMRREEVALHRWIDAHLGREDVVLAAPLYSLRLPARAGCRVWAGHHDQTLNAKEKRRKVARFFGDPTFDQEAFLRENHVDYVLWDTERCALKPPAALVPVGRWGSLILFRNEKEGAPYPPKRAGRKASRSPGCVPVAATFPAGSSTTPCASRTKGVQRKGTK